MSQVLDKMSQLVNKNFRGKSVGHLGHSTVVNEKTLTPVILSFLVFAWMILVPHGGGPTEELRFFRWVENWHNDVHGYEIPV